MTPIPFATKDNASARLLSGISPSTLSIPLQSGNGANLPQPYTGAATSAGSATTLNSTGISAAIGGSGAVGKFIWNKTDGGFAVITAVAANAVTCTRLLGGTTNVWNNADVWCIDAFVATFAVVNATTGAIGQYEEALVTARSTDTCTVPTGGRGYNGTTANTFSAGDYVYLLSTSPVVERFKDLVAEVQKQQDTDRTTLASHTTSLTNILSNASFAATTTGSSNAYAVTLSDLPAAYTTNEQFCVKANFSNTGACTMNRSGLGAKNVKVFTYTGIGDPWSGAIQSNGIYFFQYDGTQYLLLNPTPAAAATPDVDVLFSSCGLSNTAGASSTSEITHTWSSSVGSLTIPANTFLQGGTLVIRGQLEKSGADTSSLKIKLGGTTLHTISITSANSICDVEVRVRFEGSPGASCAIRSSMRIWVDSTTLIAPATTTGTMDTTGTLAVATTNQQGSSGASNYVQWRTFDFHVEKV